MISRHGLLDSSHDFRVSEFNHARWGNGERSGPHGARLHEPAPNCILARCDLCLADHRREPEVPYASTDCRWELQQYLAGESGSNAAYGSVSRPIPGVTHCDRNLFAGDSAELHRYWGVDRARA